MLPPNILCRTSTIADGDMSFTREDKIEAIANRTKFLEKNGITYTDHIAMICNHGETITLITNHHLSPLQSEVLVTQQKNIALFLLTADCLPVSLYDPVTQTIALAHISRKTLVQKLVQKTIGFLYDELDVQPQNLKVYIGPHIKKESYVFALPLQEQSVELENYIEIKDGFAYVDLERACCAQLVVQGIQAEQISISEIDTRTSRNHFSYYRMQKNQEPNTARMATILMLK